MIPGQGEPSHPDSSFDSEYIAFESNIDPEVAHTLLTRAKDLCAGMPRNLIVLADGKQAVIGYRLDDHPIPNPRESEMTVDVFGGLRWRVFKQHGDFMLTVTESLGRDGQRLATGLATQELSDNLMGATPTERVIADESSPSDQA
jgi:hypothetical protein